MLKDGMLVITWPRAAAVHRPRAPAPIEVAPPNRNPQRRRSQESTSSNSSNSARVPIAVDARTGTEKPSSK